MQVHLGTIAPVGFDDIPPEQYLECLRRLGCTTVQVYRNQQAQVSVRQMLDVVAAGQMQCDSLHGVFGEQFDPSSPLEQARRFAVDIYKAEGELALKLGGPLVVVHCSTIRRAGIPAEDRTVRIDQLKKSIVELGQFGRSIGVKYAFENLPGYHPVGSNVAELAGILKSLAAPNTGLCFDTGHANLTGDPAEIILKTAGQVIYIHYSDNSGQSDDHKMPTFGSIDNDALARSICATGYTGTLMLETFYPIGQLEKLIDEGYADRLAEIIAIANGRD